MLDLPPLAPADLVDVEQTTARLAAAMAGVDLSGHEPRAWLEGVVENVVLADALLASWTPRGPSSTPIHLVAARNGNGDEPHDHGWGQWLSLASRAVVDGDHFGMLRAPHVDQTAEHVSTLLGE
jgi:thioesterase domain-containing protein